MKHVIFWSIFFVFAIANIVDIVTAVSGQSQYEANPLFLHTKSFFVPIAIKVFMIGTFFLFWWTKKFSSDFSYYILILAMVYGSLVVSLGAASNIYAMMYERSITEAAVGGIPVDDDLGIKVYWAIATIFYIIPVGLSALAYWIQRKTIGLVSLKKEVK